MKRVFPLLMAACVLPVIGLADLHDPSNAADYMIVTTQELMDTYPWINQLASWRNDHGRMAMVVATDSVWAEFGTGVPSDTVLKTFLHYARENWQEPQLKDVFIIGFHDVVPSHVEHDSLGNDAFDYLSDFFYATDPDSNNHLPVLNVGRLPWTAEGDDVLWDYYNKVIAYETSATSPWQARVHLIADTIDGIFDFAGDFAEAMAGQVQPGYVIERDYLDFPDGDPWHGDRQEILSNMNAGSYLLEYHGHFANCYDDTCHTVYWSPALQLDSLDFAALTNAQRLPIVIGMGYDLMPDSFDITGIPSSLLLNPNGGAIGYFGWTGSWVLSGIHFKRHLTRLATSDSVETLGELWNLSSTRFRESFGNNEISSVVRTTLYGCMLFGDPGLVLPARPTAVDDVSDAVPQGTQLIGNYPNPFNASTVIKFELDRAANMSLKVYDVLGREAASLVNENHNAGSYAVMWDASRSASGVYFAVLQADDVRQTMKMMMLK